jgi:predicted DNA-binding transcriptional regulator AlpA
MHEPKPLTNAGLPKLVGYKELEEAFGLTRRQLERMQRDGRFPLAIDITGAGGNRRAWPLQQVLDWFEQRRACVTRLAVSQPDKLKPEQVANAAFDLTARHLSNEIGKSVSADDVVLGLVQRLSPKESDAATIAQWVALWRAVEERMAQLDQKDSLGVIYGLFPAMRSFLMSRRGALEEMAT